MSGWAGEGGSKITVSKADLSVVTGLIFGLFFNRNEQGFGIIVLKHALSW